MINYDLPTSAVSYIHRIGRTGRAGRKGEAVTYFTDDDKPHLRTIANVIKQAGCPVPKSVQFYVCLFVLSLQDLTVFIY